MHEMVHFATPGNWHGKKFKKEIRRLSRLGFKFVIDWKGTRKRSAQEFESFSGKHWKAKE